MGRNANARPQILAYLYRLPEHQLRDPKGHIPRLIGSTLGMKPPNVSILLVALEEAGLIWRRRNSTKRTIAAGLTEEGIEVAAEVSIAEPPETPSVGAAPTQAAVAEAEETTEEQLRQTIAGLRQKVTDLEIELRNTKENRRSAITKSRAQTPQKQASVVSQRITDLVRADTEKDEEIRRLNMRVAELEKQSAAVERRRVERLEEELTKLRSRLAQAEQAFTNAKAEAATQSREARTLRDELNRQRLLQRAA
jgi:DNA-binding MarR family transcriptional regulator